MNTEGVLCIDVINDNAVVSIFCDPHICSVGCEQSETTESSNF